MHFSTMCSSCPRNHLQTDIPKEEIYFQLVCHSRAKYIYVKQYMAKEERKKIRLVFCPCDHCQFQDLSFQQSYIKLKVFVFFSKGVGKKAVYFLTRLRMGQQLLEEQKEDLHYWFWHSQKYRFLLGSAVDKWTYIYRLSRKSFFPQNYKL